MRFKFLASLALIFTGVSQSVTGAAITVTAFNFGAPQHQTPVEKNSRTAAQKKIDSQLLYALKQKRGETTGVPTEPIEIELDSKARALVDISANVSPQVQAQIRKLGGAIQSQDERYHTIRARLALEKLEALAALKDVRFIGPAALPQTNRVKPK